jgi:hypothetical protein
MSAALSPLAEGHPHRHADVKRRETGKIGSHQNWQWKRPQSGTGRPTWTRSLLGAATLASPCL